VGLRRKARRRARRSAALRGRTRQALGLGRDARGERRGRVARRRGGARDAGRHSLDVRAVAEVCLGDADLLGLEVEHDVEVAQEAVADDPLAARGRGPQRENALALTVLVDRVAVAVGEVVEQRGRRDLQLDAREVELEGVEGERPVAVARVVVHVVLGRGGCVVDRAGECVDHGRGQNRVARAAVEVERARELEQAADVVAGLEADAVQNDAEVEQALGDPDLDHREQRERAVVLRVVDAAEQDLARARVPVVQKQRVRDAVDEALRLHGDRHVRVLEPGGAVRVGADHRLAVDEANAENGVGRVRHVGHGEHALDGVVAERDRVVSVEAEHGRRVDVGLGVRLAQVAERGRGRRIKDKVRAVEAPVHAVRVRVLHDPQVRGPGVDHRTHVLPVAAEIHVDVVLVEPVRERLGHVVRAALAEPVRELGCDQLVAAAPRRLRPRLLDVQPNRARRCEAQKREVLHVVVCGSRGWGMIVLYMSGRGPCVT